MTGLNTKASLSLPLLQQISINTEPLQSLNATIQQLSTAVVELTTAVQSVNTALAILPAMRDDMYEVRLYSDQIASATQGLYALESNVSTNTSDVVMAIYGLQSVMKALNCCENQPAIIYEPDPLPAPNVQPDNICRSIQYLIDRAQWILNEFKRILDVSDNISVNVVSGVLFAAGIPSVGLTILATSLVNAASALRTTYLHPLLATEFQRISSGMLPILYSNSSSAQSMKQAIDAYIDQSDIAMLLKPIYKAWWSYDRLNKILSGDHNWPIQQYDDICNPWQYQQFTEANVFEQMGSISSSDGWKNIINPDIFYHAGECRIAVLDFAFGYYEDDGAGNWVLMPFTAHWRVQLIDRATNNVVFEEARTSPTSYGGVSYVDQDPIYPQGVAVRLDIMRIGEPTPACQIEWHCRLAGYARNS